MIELLADLSEGVVGLRASGEVTSADYEDVVMPAVSEALRTREKVNLLYLMDDGVSYDAAAMWDDAKVGMDHVGGWNRIAVASNDGRIRAMVKLFGLTMPGRVRVFGRDDEQAARSWVSAASEPGTGQTTP